MVLIGHTTLKGHRTNLAQKGVRISPSFCPCLRPWSRNICTGNMLSMKFLEKSLFHHAVKSTEPENSNFLRPFPCTEPLRAGIFLLFQQKYLRSTIFVGSTYLTRFYRPVQLSRNQLQQLQQFRKTWLFQIDLNDA